MKNKGYILFRTFQFADGTEHRVNMGIYTDATDAQKAGDRQGMALRGMAQPVMAALKYLGVENIGHGALEIDLTQGAGLVAPPAGLILP